MHNKRTFCTVKMNGLRFWLAAAVLQTLLLAASCGNHRRSMATQATLPSKGGWRPVVGSNGLIYGSFGTAPLHAPLHNYKIPVPVLDIQQYASSARPLASRDAAKLTSIAQSYRPTTLRTVPTQQTHNQPINSYHNPFAIQNNAIFPSNALNYYKHVQNYPIDSVLIRNPHNPYAARPVYQKYPQKFKQQLQNNVLQQLTSIQPIQFGQYQTPKPLDMYGKPIENYARPNEAKKQQQPNSGIETYKPEVYKLPDSDTASQSVSQQVKTAQQQNFVGQNQVYNPFPQYSFQDTLFPPSILGTFGSFGVQSVKGRDPLYPPTKATYLQQPTKTTIFNSFNYSPNYKPTPAVYNPPSTTPRQPTTPNQYYSSTFGDFKITPTPHTKVSTPPKIDPNANVKDSFKPSPYDPFSKTYQSDFNKVTTYNPIQTTANTLYEYNYQSQYNEPNHYNQQQTQQNVKYTHENKKQMIHDSIPAGGNQQVTKQYANPPRSEKDGTLTAQIRPTYEVTETTESEVNAQSSAAPWHLTSQPYDSFKSTEESVRTQEYSDYGRPNPTPIPEVPEEYAIVTEVEKGYQNSLGYDGQVESHSRRPLGDDFEPINKHKLKDYYYKVSTPAYDDYSVPRRTKKPTESSKSTTTSETTTASTVSSSDIIAEALPTLPPNQHFKRPNLSTPESPTIDKDRIRKRNKIRRRRPPLANLNRNRDETSTRLPTTKFAETTQTETEEVHTIKPRVRPTTNAKLQSQYTTPSVTTDLTTSALPTISPTAPTIVKKKLVRRPLTTTTASEKVEATTITGFKIYETNKDSPIMKISNRVPYPKSTSTVYEYKTEETPDYTHKQDEKDTPTSDVSVFDTLRTTAETELDFAFHKDVKPIEAKLEPVTSRYRETTTDNDATNEVTTFSPRTETNSNTGKIQRPRLRNKYNRPKFSVKDYKSRLGSTTTTDKPVETTQKVRFPQRRPYTDSPNSEGENTTERKRFIPKEARNKINNTDSTQETYTVRQPLRQRQTAHTAETESTTKQSARIRNRRPRPTEETTEPLPTTFNTRRPLRKKIKDSEIEESVQDLVVTESIVPDLKDITSERTRSESAIMKIADKKHHDHSMENLFEHSKRVSDLTLAASKDYNKPGMFKTVSTNSRRIPNYFTIATDDPILPIEAFFPQLNQKKES